VAAKETTHNHNDDYKIEKLLFNHMNLISIYNNYNIILVDPLIYSSVNSIFYGQGKKKVIVPCGVHEDEVRIIFFQKIAFHKVTKCNCTK